MLTFASISYTTTAFKEPFMLAMLQVGATLNAILLYTVLHGKSPSFSDLKGIVSRDGGQGKALEW
jgi:hypothetical protein